MRKEFDSSGVAGTGMAEVALHGANPLAMATPALLEGCLILTPHTNYVVLQQRYGRSAMQKSGGNSWAVLCGCWLPLDINK